MNSNDSTKKESLLDQAYLKEILHYDPETGIFTWLVALSNNIKVGSQAGKPTRYRYGRIKIGGYQYKSHRLAWLYITGSWPKSQIDHRDLDKMNNRWENLRETENFQNQGNVIARNKSGLKGVTKHRNRYTAGLCGKYLGSFATPEEAHDKYKVAALEYFGEFARV